jgi:hypothetical protein
MIDLNLVRILLKEAYLEGFTDGRVGVEFLADLDAWNNSCMKKLIDNDDNWIKND